MDARIQAQLIMERRRAQQGERPDGKARPWESRAQPYGDEGFGGTRQKMLNDGIQADVQAIVMGSNGGPDTQLISIIVRPKSHIYAFQAPYEGTPWHVTLAYTNRDGTFAPEALPFFARYGEERRVHMWFHDIKERSGVAYLSTRFCDVASDPVVQALFEVGGANHTGMHVSF